MAKCNKLYSFAFESAFATLHLFRLTNNSLAFPAFNSHLQRTKLSTSKISIQYHVIPNIFFSKDLCQLVRFSLN